MESWDDLRLFLAVARAGTLTGAAPIIGVNASTLHRRLSALESTLESRLFVKQPTGYSLTPVGEALLPRAIEVEEAMFAADRAVRGHDLQATGEVRLTTTADLVPLLGPHLQAFREVCAGVVPVLVVDDAVVDLGRGSDVALRPSEDPPPDAIGRRLGPVPWARYGRTEDAPWATYDGLGQVAAVRWRRQQHPIEAAVVVDRVVAMRSLVEQGFQGMLPCYVGDAVGVPRLETPDVPAASLWLLIHADLRRAARVRALVDFLVPRLVEALAR